MLESLLRRSEAGQSEARWDAPAPGVRVCRFRCALSEGAVPPLGPDRLEALFCLGGRLQLIREDRAVRIGRRELLLLSGGAPARLQPSGGPLQGILVALDLSPPGPLPGSLRPDVPQLTELLARCGGCTAVRETPWTDAAFAELDHLPEDEQGRYCVFKTLELLYLLGRRNALPSREPSAGYYDDHQLQAVREVRAYMASHLSEPLTIDALCRRFHLSSTLLKSCFRAIYGRPIHSWLREQRLLHAADLLCATDQPVTQVAAAAGYGSTSQFGVAFRERFQATPSQYRRMHRTKNV